MNELDKSKYQEFVQKFNICKIALCAIGNETRQLIIQILIENCKQGGLRVGEIQTKANLSRAALAHHLKILKEANIINVRHEGTKNYYYLDATSTSLIEISNLFQEALVLMNDCKIIKEID